MVQRDSSAIKFDRVYIVFIVLAESLTDEEGEETGKTRETPGDELQKMPHTEAGRLKPQVRLKLRNSIGGRLGKQTCLSLQLLLWLDEIASLTCEFYVSVAACTVV